MLELSSMPIQKSKSLNKAVKEKQAELDECTKKYELACFYKSAIIVDITLKNLLLSKTKPQRKMKKIHIFFCIQCKIGQVKNLIFPY